MQRAEEQRRLFRTAGCRGQQMPIVVVGLSATPDSSLVSDGYKRIAALEA